MTWRRILVIVLVLAALGGGIWWAFQPQPVGVDLAEARRGTLTVTVSDEGVAEIRETYKISTPIGGQVQRIPFSVGDPVGEGATIASIVPQQSGFLDDRTYAEAQAAVRAARAAVHAAEADLAGAETSLAYWQTEAERTAQLLERGVVTRSAMEEAELQLEQRRVQVNNAQAALELRERQLEQAEAQLLEPGGSDERGVRYDITAPADGRIIEIANDSSRILAAGTHLMTIGDPGNLRIVVELLSSDAVSVVAGAPAEVTGWGGDVALAAEVQRIEPVGFTKVSALGIEEQRVKVHLSLTSPPSLWQGLGHLYRVFVAIETLRVEDSVLVPVAALFRDNNNWAVFIHEDGVARFRQLRLGARNSDFAVVSEGLDAGDAVILHPNDTISDGGLIVAREE